MGDSGTDNSDSRTATRDGSPVSLEDGVSRNWQLT
jgi:hypothetical protein